MSEDIEERLLKGSGLLPIHMGYKSMVGQIEESLGDLKDDKAYMRKLRSVRAAQRNAKGEYKEERKYPFNGEKIAAPEEAAQDSLLI